MRVKSPQSIVSPPMPPPPAAAPVSPAERKRLQRQRADAGAVVLPAATVLPPNTVDGMVAARWCTQWDADNDPAAVARKLLQQLADIFGADDDDGHA